MAKSLRLIVGDHNHSAATVDLSLLKAVARAHRWFYEISTGKLPEIAAREGLAVRYIGRLIRLVFLAPAACLFGTQRHPSYVESPESSWRLGHGALHKKQIRVRIERNSSFVQCRCCYRPGSR
jgi:hypothetical protein